jgi:hypothetical protein
MARYKSLQRDLELATAGLAPQAIAAALAQFARDELSKAVREGEGSPIYDRYVNTFYGRDESDVVPPGPILYVFHWWNEIIPFALDTLQKRSPVRSGRFKTSWFVMVNGQRVIDYTSIPIGAEVIITNDQPYARKIEVGFMKMSVPHAVADDARKTIMSRLGNMVEVRKTMITLPNGYTLKGVFKRGIRQHSRTKLRRDTQAGAQMTYPALRITMR